MKTLLITTSISLLSVFCSAQTLTISDFICFRKLNKEQFKMEFEKSTLQIDDIEEIKKHVTRTTYKLPDNADNTCDLIFVNHLDIDKSNNRNRVSFQFKSDEILYKYLVEMKKLNFDEILYKIVDRQMIHVFSDGYQTLEIITSKSLYTYDTNIYYTLAIYDDLEYNTQFAEENSKYKIQDDNEIYNSQNAIGLYSSIK